MKKQEMLLSIGLIFKNEIRCLERCLKSFQPLRGALPGQVEIVAADTGSTDGSREIAEKYADILIDFPWVNDFAAARNVVMDHSSGQWFFTVDADEWLDEDISQLLKFMRVCDRAPGNICTVLIRNYATAALNEDCLEFMGMRMVRMSTGARYVGKIHERLNLSGDMRSFNTLDETILHHDGYVCLNDGSEEGKKKTARNLELIEEELKDSPYNMLLRMQWLDCARFDVEKAYAYAQECVSGIKEHWDNWEIAGLHILCHLIRMGKILQKPEFWDWVALAEETYPNSIFLRVDIYCYATEYAWNANDYQKVAIYGERYLEGLADYRTKNFDQGELVTGLLQTVRANVENILRAYVARAHLYNGRTEKALETLRSHLAYEGMEKQQISALAATMLLLHSMSREDTAPLICEFWEGISQHKPSEEIAKSRVDSLLAVCAIALTPAFRENEMARMDDPSANMSNSIETVSEAQWDALNGCPMYRHAYTLFLPLVGQGELGTAAAILNTDDPDEISDFLAGLEDVKELPISALYHALERRTPFPLKGRPLNLEEMDSLAARLFNLTDKTIQFALSVDAKQVNQDIQALCWNRGLIMASVRSFPWAQEDADQDQGVALAKSFANMERVFLPCCFAPEVLNEQNLFMLPPMHRFGWYCAQAFDALEQGNVVEYIRLLRSGLDVCEGVKDMVEFLADHTQEVQQLLTPPELKALADQVRVILARFDPNDPAVTALKQSEVYQKVAHLIEGTQAVVWGGQLQ